jgi:predicted permease
MLIACVNVTNLLLARGVQRRAEFALRVALGAGRARLTRQLLTESLLLAALGGVAGFAVAALGVRALVAWVPPDLPRAGSIAINAPLLAFAIAATTLVGVAVGVIPTFQAARSDPHADLQHGARHTRAHTAARGALVVTEVGLALVLLVSSGLLLRSMQALFAEPVGFDPSHLITMQVQLVGHRFDDGAVADRYRDAVLDAVRRAPGVTSAGFTEQLPLSGDRDEYGAQFSATATLPSVTYGAFRYAVTPGYLETMRIPLRRGRLLDGRDRGGAPLAALVSESLATERFGPQDPIGQRLRIGSTGPFTVVGVVGDVRQLSLALTDADAVYLNASQSWFSNRAMSLVARTRGDAAALAPAIRQAIASVDKDQPVARIATMQKLLAASAADRRFALLLFEAFAVAALILAAAGIYGVLAGAVAERTREIGVRTALGATRVDIVALVLRQGMLLTALGVAIGLAGAATATRAIAAMLFSVSRLDPATYAGVVVLLAAASAIACAVPAWRASRVDPAITLRAE